MKNILSSFEIRCSQFASLLQQQLASTLYFIEENQTGLPANFDFNKYEHKWIHGVILSDG